MLHPETFDIEIESVASLAPRVKAFGLSRVDGRPLTHRPGQWLNLVLPSPLGELRRAFSIASPPTSTPRFEIAVADRAAGTGYLYGLGQGQRLRAIGPHGAFTREANEPAPALLVATGTGITPLRSMLKAALRAGSRTPMWLLLGARREQDLLYRGELENLADEHANVRMFFTLSQAERAWAGRRGYVQIHVPEILRELSSSGAEAPHVYACGLSSMIQSVRELVCAKLGLARDLIHSEWSD